MLCQIFEGQLAILFFEQRFLATLPGFLPSRASGSCESKFALVSETFPSISFYHKRNYRPSFSIKDFAKLLEEKTAVFRAPDIHFKPWTSIACCVSLVNKWKNCGIWMRGSLMLWTHIWVKISLTQLPRPQDPSKYCLKSHIAVNSLILHALDADLNFYRNAIVLIGFPRRIFDLSFAWQSSSPFYAARLQHHHLSFRILLISH